MTDGFMYRFLISAPPTFFCECSLSEEQKSCALTRRADILKAVKSTINIICDPSNPNYKANLTAEEILISAGVSEQDYYWALAISSDSDFELHLKRPPDSCFINNYFIAGIKAFAANVGLQPVFNHYKCTTYICSYFSRDETECSQAITNAAKEARNSNLNIQDSLKKIGAAFLSTREVSAQECVYRCMPKLWLRKVFPKTLFVNTDFPQNRLRIPKNQDDLDELEDDSTDIFKSNIIEHYSNRPKAILSADKLCLAEFAAFYYKDYKIPGDETNDAQPDILTDQVAELQHGNTSTYTTETLPNKIKLLVTNEVMKCKKIRAVIRFHTPNKQKEPEKVFHHLLMLYFPWRNEVLDLTGPDNTYASKFFETGVQYIVDINRSKFEQNADEVSEALELLRNNELGNLHSYDSITDQDIADIRCDLESDVSLNESFHEQDPEHLGHPQFSQPHTCNTIVTHSHSSDISDDALHESIRSLNSNQRHAYNTVLTWCRTKLMLNNSNQTNEIEPLYLFITGGGGTGKSHVIRVIYHTVVKTFRHGLTNPEMIPVLMMAPTGVAAVNIDGTTINTGLAIPKDVGDNLPALSDQKRTQLRILLAQLKVIIIDEISMVSNTMLLNIHNCIRAVRAWMIQDKMKLNDDKTEFLIIGASQQLKNVRTDTLFVGDAIISPVLSARNLGAYFDSNMTLVPFINNACQSAFSQLYNIRRIRKYLSTDTSKTLVHAMITSRIDYCNSLLCGLPDNSSNKLRRVQNAAARLITETAKFSHITPVLRSLHWLPIKQRVQFKLLILVFKAINGLARNYISNLVNILRPSKHLLRRNNEILLEPYNGKTKKTLGYRAFAVAAPRLFNSLSREIRHETCFNTFKTKVKTFLFRTAFC